MPRRATFTPPRHAAYGLSFQSYRHAMSLPAVTACLNTTTPLFSVVTYVVELLSISPHEQQLSPSHFTSLFSRLRQ